MHEAVTSVACVMVAVHGRQDLQSEALSLA
jgi:hypothetical protein